MQPKDLKLAEVLQRRPGVLESRGPPHDGDDGIPCAHIEGKVAQVYLAVEEPGDYPLAGHNALRKIHIQLIQGRRPTNRGRPIVVIVDQVAEVHAERLLQESAGAILRSSFFNLAARPMRFQAAGRLGANRTGDSQRLPQCNAEGQAYGAAPSQALWLHRCDSAHGHPHAQPGGQPRLASAGHQEAHKALLLPPELVLQMQGIATFPRQPGPVSGPRRRQQLILLEQRS
mmetsp:Transcript_136679/g.424589  ORF Transcript_136679/g.424589 Transcript_136679/m.424589 type:complete len:229 (+) Transcript_136679:765-1451(+)